MTDRIQGFIVVLDSEYRTDDAEAILEAIRMIKGVLDVQPAPALRPNDYITRKQVEHELRTKLYKALEGDE
jgi:hypothetical protein